MEAKMEIDDDVELSNVEYVSEQLDIKGAALEAFSDVFARFQPPPEEVSVRLAHVFPLSAQSYAFPRSMIKSRRREKSSGLTTAGNLKVTLKQSKNRYPRRKRAS
jgi:hypothetical protein